MSTLPPKRIRYFELCAFVERIFMSYGMSSEHASMVSRNLCLADLRGIASHGVARLEGYCRLIEAGRIEVKPTFHWETNHLSAATLNAGGAIGLLSAEIAMDAAIQKAHNTGCAFIAVKHSNHFGIASAYVMRAMEQGMIGWAMTNASPLVAPPGSARRFFGTNPLCIGFPFSDQEPGSAPFILDMASSAVANGKLEIATRNRYSIPFGWVVDAEGIPSQDPSILKQGGSLLPLGSDEEHGVHKGYGLAAVIDLLSGVLGGAAFGPWVPPFVAFLNPLEGGMGQGIGHLVGVMNPQAFSDLNEYKERIACWMKTLKASNKPRQKVVVHGEPEHMAQQKGLQDGVKIEEVVLQKLRVLAQQKGVSMPPENS